MASVIPHPRFAPAPSLPAACCLNQAHDAHRLAQTLATVATPGTILDIGCGSGSVAIPVLLARRDLHAVGVEVSPTQAAIARNRATQLRVADRFELIVGDALDIELPHGRSVVANPPMLPTEPWFSLPSPEGGEALFWMALLRRLAERSDVADIWLHLFDFQGVGRRFGSFPSVEEVAAKAGFEVGYPHRGWRAVGPGSAIPAALPALSRLFPEAIANVGGSDVRFADLPHEVTRPLLIRHSIVRLHRPRALQGGLR